MYFAAESIARLEADRAAMDQRRIEVLNELLARAYQVPRAKEFAEHGVSRRLRTITHCIENVFAILPPTRDDHPPIEELIDAVVYIQAFIFNAFACLDNLAWIWVCEKKLTTEDGERIPAGKVGLSKHCKVVRRSLPADFRKHLKSLDAWFDNLENFRHALAHRIPLYIPPSAVAEKDLAAYRLLEMLKAKAQRQRKWDKYRNLDGRQKALTRYQPEMIHSPTDNSKRIVFHPQLLLDFETICNLCSRMNTALDSEPAISATRMLRTILSRAKNVFSSVWSKVTRSWRR